MMMMMMMMMMFMKVAIFHVDSEEKSALTNIFTSKIVTCVYCEHYLIITETIKITRISRNNM